MGWYIDGNRDDEKTLKGKQLNLYSKKFNENSLLENKHISSWILDLFGRIFNESERYSPLTHRLKSILNEECLIQKIKENSQNKLSDSFSFGHKKTNERLRLNMILTDFTTLIINILIKLSLYIKKKLNELINKHSFDYSEDEKRFQVLLEKVS